jgi:nucleoside-diphosphate-sugar epimerase
VRPGTQKRAFTYVKDLARGIVLAGKRGTGDRYALGQTRSYSITEIAKAFGGPIRYVDGYAGRERARNPIKARRELGWKPTVDVIDYIKEFVAANPRHGQKGAG